MSKQIAVIVGSLRKESYNKKMAKVLIAMAPKSLNLEIVEIGNLPLYNQDLDDENRPPQAWVQFREQMKTYEGVLFVTPEYNRSVPGVLKNAIDVGSRPYGKSIWSKLPGAVISVSPGAIGGFGANNHLRQSFVFLDIPTLQQPESYIGGAGDLFDDQGNIIKEDTKKFLQKFIDAYAAWVELNTKD
ncbi:NAD(P)H-dependent oxidoreductase [Fluoribacter dumoffii]|uniref:NADPH azoreductase n=1 Tax=Fluoribacter dumoffii TaxID=463 RepID=A0A377G6M6_9GAMM|nr:NAD(P)H-dependent oxidoreductase [Fluoribacter dumoffii]KTC91673.1 chromate reductase, Class I, flavoprotein [Fluoribacter dumoffii NY 23]MCW8417293.1 NAD(P)H-dependent oxidoreductase [Fluoribacter dumoffii]MCW8454866.1 NAD(P)H-dependent oxidoreductase [Fluoribacter dumoffii]MCW8461057.1 NAD(P)H-dependent oxidoreductase [Fluoribacter dumoffii]MCW8484498.1 NAD(P)H-dependent oxidoreductase [Fluoribacter dumoffii]